MTIPFAQKEFATAHVALQIKGRLQRYLASLHCYNAVLSHVEDKFPGSEAIQIIAGLHSSLTATNNSKMIIFKSSVTIE